MGIPTSREVRGEIRKSETSFFRRPLAMIPVVVFLFLATILAPKIIETNYEGNYIVKQQAVTGTMSVRVKPGMFGQWFSELTLYKKADTFTFSNKAKDVKGRLTQPIEVRYQDGAKGNMMGNVRFRLSLKPKQALKLHREFKSYNAVLNDMILPSLRQSILLTAAQMTAESSYTGGRLEIDRIVEDQLRNGIFKTQQIMTKVKNSITGDMEERSIATKVLDKNGEPVRETSVLSEYGVQIIQVVITDLDYEESVKAQIAAKRKAIQEAATAKANAERAKQDRLTAEQEGLKNVKIAQMKEEEAKIKAIVAAERKFEVAKLDRKTAEQTKLKLIALGQGEAARKRAVYLADGALDKKIAAIKYIADRTADAVKNAKHPFVPTTVFGGSSGSTNGAQAFIDMMTLKAAKDLSLDLRTK